MSHYSFKHDPLSKLVFELSKLPGIGEKTATRLAYFILNQNEMDVRALSEALLDAKKKIQLCTECLNYTDTDPCRICSSSNRDVTLLCIVERPTDVFSIERTGCFKGLYHVLHGVLSPLDGIGPDQLRMRELLQRITKSFSTTAGTMAVQEVILAMNPSVEGDATSLYLFKTLKPLGIKVTKLAHGIPAGGQLEYSDLQTVTTALQNRMELHQ